MSPPKTKMHQQVASYNVPNFLKTDPWESEWNKDAQVGHTTLNSPFRIRNQN